MFDPQQFINQGVAFAMPDQYPLVPEGDYPATCVDYKVKPGDSDHSPLLEVYWKLDGVQAAPRKQGIWLDVDANGALLQGGDVNIGLGMLRTALNQNVAGQPWGPEMLRNQRALVHVGHSKNGKYDNVTRVARLTQAGVPGQAPPLAPTGPVAPPSAPPPPTVPSGPPPGAPPAYAPPGAPPTPQAPWGQPLPTAAPTPAAGILPGSVPVAPSAPAQAPIGQPPAGTAASSTQPAQAAPAWGPPGQEQPPSQ